MEKNIGFFLMNFVLIMILFSGLYGLEKEELPGIDVLKTLKEKKISCNFRNFVQSNDNSDDEYDVLIDDLRKYCSTSTSGKQYHVLCHMILIEFEIGCLLSNASRPYPIKYTTSFTSKQICSMTKISYTNIWIWKKLPSNERDEIGPTTSQLCPKLTSLNDTLRLTRFFYKMAPRIRRADTSNTPSAGNKPSEDLSVDKKPLKEETNNKSKTNVEKKEGQTTNKTQLVLDLKDKRLKKLSQREKKNDDGDDDGNLIYSNEEDKKADVDVEDQPQKLDDVKKSDEKINRIKKKRGSPLGRAGEKPEQEQVNERPKPKSLDVESVFKSNDRKELRNWVEGKNGDKQLDNAVPENVKRYHRLKLDENPIVNPSIPRKRLSLRSRLSKYGNNHGWSNSFVTSFLLFTLLIIAIYLILSNRNKILGLIIEGCKRNRIFHARRFGSSFTPRRHVRLSQSN